MLILALMLVFSGVSYRFSSVCHINSTDSIKDYWIPILVFFWNGTYSSIVTMGYCMYVSYQGTFRPIGSNKHLQFGSTILYVSSRTASCSTGIQTCTTSSQTAVAINGSCDGHSRQCHLLAVTFLQLDSDHVRHRGQSPESQTMVDLSGGVQDPAKCTAEASDLGLTEGSARCSTGTSRIASFWNFIFTIRMTWFRGWLEFWQSLFAKNVEFVSSGCAFSLWRYSANYEMLSHQNTMKTPEPTPFEVRSPTPAYVHGRVDEEEVDGKDIELSTHSRQASYTRPTMSFSTPRPPTGQRSPANYTWDAISTFARSNSQMSNHNPRYR